MTTVATGPRRRLRPLPGAHRGPEPLRPGRGRRHDRPDRRPAWSRAPRATAYHATIAAGLVIGSTPPAGALVGPGHVVDYVLSLGPIAVPNLSGLTEAAAKTALTNALLVPGTASSAYHAHDRRGPRHRLDPARG